MRSFDPQFSDRTFDPRPVVATIGTLDDARKTAAEHFRTFAEDCPTFRSFDREIRRNTGTL